MTEKGATAGAGNRVILTPDQRLRVFVSSTLQELAEERAAARDTIARLRLSPVMFELGARPHPPRDLYRSYLEQSHIFVGIYWQSYGWVAPDMAISGLEDEYRLSGNRPKLMYVKSPAPDREPRLKEMLGRIKADDTVSYKPFSTAAELGQLIADDLALLLTERFQASASEQAGEPNTRAPGVAVRPKLNNLPAQATPLIGRERDVQLVCDLVRRRDVRLVRCLGRAASAKHGWRWLRPSSSWSTSPMARALWRSNRPAIRNCASAIAHALGVRETDASSLRNNLMQFVADRHVLLVLDNFEQVIDAAPIMAELLSAAPQLEMLVTSRVVLRLSGEHEFPVPALELPDLGQLPAVDRVAECTAVRLFVERAQAAKSEFAVTPQNAYAVAEICHRLDGLPLAIELAAARIRLLTPEAMLTRLAGTSSHSSLKLLTGGARDHPSRQQTLRNTIEWSHSLLDAAEQRLFAALSVFVGGCTLDAVSAVYGDESEEADLLDLMSSLVDKSLVVRGLPSPIDGEPRFNMLQVIREYALERLEASGQADAARQRHAAHYTGFARRADPEIRGAHQMIWLARLTSEHDNLRAVLRWSLDSGDGAGATELIWLLWLFWLINAHLQEAQQWAEEALAHVDALSPRCARATWPSPAAWPVGAACMTRRNPTWKKPSPCAGTTAIAASCCRPSASCA